MTAEVQHKLHTHQQPLSRLTKDQVREKYDDFAPVYRFEEWLNNNLFRLRAVRRELFKEAEGRILDVAAGSGANFPFLPSESEITAVDLSPGMLAEARKRAEGLGLTVSFQVMDAEALEFEDHTFDTVISTLSTCTFPDPIAALREMARVVRPGGRILLIEHGRSSWGFVGRYQDRTAHKHYVSAGCRWNQEPLELVQEAGLQVVRHQRNFAGVFHLIEARAPAP